MLDYYYTMVANDMGKSRDYIILALFTVNSHEYPCKLFKLEKDNEMNYIISASTRLGNGYEFLNCVITD